MTALPTPHDSPPTSQPPPPATTPAASGEAALKRRIGVLLGAMLVVNATIGTGIFKTPAKVARLAGTLPAFFATWAAGGLIALCGALTLGELAAAYPRTGGLYEYLRRAYGPTPAFVYGWTKLTLLIPSAVGSFARLAAEALAAVRGQPPDAARERVAAVGFVAVCALANLVGVRASARQQGAITAVKYLGVALLAVLGLFVAPAAVAGVVPIPVDPPAFQTSATFLGCFTALVSVMWAYDGWADLSALAGEVKNPERTMPRALLAGTAAIVLVYLLANAGYARALGLEGLRYSTTGSNLAAANVATQALGGAGRRLLAALILVSCVGGCMSSLLTGSRTFVPLATDGLFIRALGAVTPRTAVPARAVIVSAALGAAYVTFRSFEQLTDAFVVGYFPFYILAVAAVFVLRWREPRVPRPFRVPGYPLTPCVFLAGAGALMVGAVMDADRTALGALGVVLLGVPLRFVWRRGSARGGASA